MYCLGFIIFLSTFLYAQDDTRSLKIEQVNPKLYVYTTYNQFQGERYSANALYLLTKKGAVLFDTPWNETQYQAILDSIQFKHNLPVIAVFATHWHSDRAGGFAYYNKKGIPTYATTQTNALLNKHKEAKSTKLIDLGKIYKIGGKRFQIEYFGEGHSLDNVVVWFPEYGILNGGCLIKSAEAKNIGFTDDGNLQAWPATIKKILQKHPDIKTVIPGHDEWKINGHIKRTLELLKEQ